MTLINYYKCELSVYSHNKKQLEFFEDMAIHEDHGFSLFQLYPVPLEILHNHKKRQDWCQEYWGTTSEVFDVKRIEDEPFKKKFKFNISSGPPGEWLKEMGSRFPSLIFVLDYYDEGAWIESGFIHVYGNQYTALNEELY